MPGRSGLELQRDLAAANRQVPTIFITAHGDIPMTVQAMKGGARRARHKTVPRSGFLEAVQAGLARDRARRESDKALGELRERFDTLSSREREIMMQVTAGRLNKQIADDIGIAEVHGESASHPPDAESIKPRPARDRNQGQGLDRDHRRQTPPGGPMKQLTGLDATFLYMETRSQFGHVSGCRSSSAPTTRTTTR